MRRKLIIGLIMFIGGNLLDVLSDITDGWVKGIWLMGIIGTIIWPIGMILAATAIDSINQQKQRKASSDQLAEKENSCRFIIGLIIGLIMFIGGNLLDMVFYKKGIWPMGIIGAIIWPSGMCLATHAALSLHQKRKEKLRGTGDGSPP